MNPFGINEVQKVFKVVNGVKEATRAFENIKMWS